MKDKGIRPKIRCIFRDKKAKACITLKDTVDNR